MISLDDPNWKDYEGGYRIKYDASLALTDLENDRQPLEQIWDELAENLYHQGDVGIASYAAVPHLARIICQRNLFDGNAFALVAVIELARGKGNNPPLPNWLQKDYEQAIWDMAKYGIENFNQQWEEGTLQGILALMAIVKNQKELAALIFEIDLSETTMLLEKYFDM